jgi:hypothetical protein
MTSEERERLNVLCDRIQRENDPKKFTQLLAELDGLLEQQNASQRKTTRRAEIAAHGLPG